MNYVVRDLGGCDFTIDTTKRGDQVGVMVGHALYPFTPEEARKFSVALEYFALCAEETARWKD